MEEVQHFFTGAPAISTVLGRSTTGPSTLDREENMVILHGRGGDRLVHYH